MDQTILVLLTNRGPLGLRELTALLDYPPRRILLKTLDEAIGAGIIHQDIHGRFFVCEPPSRNR